MHLSFILVFKLLAADDVTSAHVSVLSCFTDCTDHFLCVPLHKRAFDLLYS